MLRRTRDQHPSHKKPDKIIIIIIANRFTSPFECQAILVDWSCPGDCCLLSQNSVQNIKKQVNLSQKR